MTLILLALAALVGGMLLTGLLRHPRRRGGRRAETAPRDATARRDAAPASAAQRQAQAAIEQAAASARSDLAPAEPDAVAALHLIRADAWPADRQRALIETFREIPRPPRLMQHLLSPAFFQSANSRQLVEMIASEPLITSRVLATVNSSRYSLSAPVSGVGQAVTYLGLNTVRALCLHYVLKDSFVADSPQRQRALEATWRASAIAVELLPPLAVRLRIAEPGPLLSALVLSFIGRLATVALLPAKTLADIPARDLLQRAAAEQAAIGLCAAEVGRLLMSHWGLPNGIVADAADIDRTLLAPEPGENVARADGLAVAYLCARLGERVAAGERVDLLTLQLAHQTDDECHHLRQRLAHPQLAGLPAALNRPEVHAALERLLAAVAV